MARSVLRFSVILLMCFFCAVLFRHRSDKLEGSQNTRSLELGGRWLTEDGRHVIVEQSGNHVYVIFAPEDDQCANGATLQYLLDADLSGVQQVTESDYPKIQASLRGKIAGCTDVNVLEQCPNLAKVWETTFDATAAPSVISGDAFIEGIDAACNVNHQYDSHSPFTLAACEDVNIMPGNPVITPDSNTKVRVRVTCHGAPVEGAKVDFEIEPQDSSGSHIHVEKRPKGKLNGKDLTDDNPTITLATDSNGEVNGPKGATFAPPAKTPDTRCVGIAGDYKITAKSHRVPDHMDHTMIWVGYQNLTPLTLGQYYDICADSTYGCTIPGPWGTTSHPDSENGTAGTIAAFQNVATDFWNWEQAHNQLLQNCPTPRTPWPPQKVSFNDIALPWGGLFDMNDTWKNPHKTHGKGQGGDFNHLHGNCPPGGCLSCGGAAVNYDTWLWSVLKNVADPKYGKWDSEVNTGGELHLHVEDQGVGAPNSCPSDD